MTNHQALKPFNCSGKKAFKIGVLCVYFVPDGWDWLISLQLQHVFGYVDDEIQVKLYASIIQAPDSVRQQLKAETGLVEIIETGIRNPLPNREHGANLDALARQAAQDGCNIIVTLDVDSFPIDPFWVRKCIHCISQGVSVISVYRSENEQAFLPHPSFTVFTSSFLTMHDFQFYPSDNQKRTPEFRTFLRESGMRMDTGVGLGYALWHKEERCQTLLRSNVKNLHYLMGGIYGDMVFHLGAMSRSPLFKRDFQTVTWRLLSRYQRLPSIWRLINRYRRNVARRNNRIHKKIVNYLRADPEVLFAYLRGTKNSPLNYSIDHLGE
ncbi:hypothetical protein U5801_14295 [Lamprobacter modestohalophilus]|uniref:hypothetical protein n=1 Tax=Lamprobacter modestohalophilus TaxID=1064514 RepID=UPI002ADEC7E5|nr:hypothetical protein [Lamprobacter modestohalophilus]MEA1050970.1 hypothetical protein [Lamprobacter modestohalophilus]